MACVRSGISGWVIGLLIRGRAGAERRAANPGRRCWPTARLAAVFCLGLGDRRWRSSSATAAAQQLAAGQPSDVLALCWILALAERDRSLNLLGKGSALTVCWSPPSRARGRRLGRRFRSAAPARSYGVCSARADRNRWLRGGCGVCALWHFRLGDRALDPWACGRRTARGQFLVAGAGRQRGSPLFSVWDLEIGGGGALRQQPLRNSWPQGSLRMCSHCVGFWHWPSATAP